MFRNEALNDLAGDAISDIVDRNVNIGIVTSNCY